MAIAEVKKEVAAKTMAEVNEYRAFTKDNWNRDDVKELMTKLRCSEEEISKVCAKCWEKLQNRAIPKVEIYLIGHAVGYVDISCFMILPNDQGASRHPIELN